MRYLIILFILFLLLGFIFQEGRICINNERAGFIFLKGGYRAWWIRYSKGLQCLSNNKFKNLWCKPRFEHYDIRKLKVSQ